MGTDGGPSKVREMLIRLKYERSWPWAVETMGMGDVDGVEVEDGCTMAVWRSWAWDMLMGWRWKTGGRWPFDGYGYGRC